MIDYTELTTEELIDVLVYETPGSQITDLTIQEILRRLKENDNCICRGNWRQIIYETELLFNRYYRNKINGKKYNFFGIVHSEDDYYYGMCDMDGKIQLLSCVGNIESFDYELIEEEN